MKKLTIRFLGERALFRNPAIPGSDVADDNLANRERAIKGLLGNMLGLWRDFDDADNLGLAPALDEWWAKHAVSLEHVTYRAAESRIIGQHRYKNPGGFMKPGESGPKPLTYHWHVKLDVALALDDPGWEELAHAIREPVGTPYLGQSNCLAQVRVLGSHSTAA